MDTSGNLYSSDHLVSIATAEKHSGLFTGLSEKKISEIQGRKVFPVSEKQYEELKPLGETNRKGYMRNQLCVCGSKVKFKKCCWSKYA